MNARNASHDPWCVSVECGQNIGMEVGDPLLSVLGDSKITQSVLDVRAHDTPVELCVALAQVAGRLVSELLVQADLLELVEEGRALS